MITRDQLETICDHADLDPDVSIRTDYSGRGMYGDLCVGFTVSGPQGLIKLGAGIQRLISEAEEGVGTALDSDVERKLLEGASTDNMGHDTIVYFPGVQLAQE
jgi:hypothetical protein